MNSPVRFMEAIVALIAGAGVLAYTAVALLEIYAKWRQ
jgi:hypothetical protein